jgi:hypothetical protein
MNSVKTVLVNDGDYLFIVVRRPKNLYDVSDPAGEVGSTGRLYRVIGGITPYIELVAIKPASNNSQMTTIRIEENALVEAQNKVLSASNDGNS